MKLALKLSRSRSSSPASSTPSSPLGTPRASPAASQKKPRFALPGFGSSGKKMSKQKAAVGEGISTPSPRASSSSPRLPHLLVRDKGKSIRASECSSGTSSPAAGMAATSWVEGRVEVEQVFAQFDANGDGRISTEDLHAVLASLGEKTTMEEAALMLREVDMDGDGFIDLEEFVEMNRRCTEECALEEEMVAAFAIFDCEKTGRITAEGLQQVLQRLGGGLAQRSSAEDCRRMIRGVDRKGAGHVDFEDFKRLMTPLIF